MTGEPVASDEILWSRIHRSLFQKGRVTSAAFKDPRMSVDMASLRLVMSATMIDTSVGVSALSCSDAEAEGQTVVRDPIEGNDAHALVVGEKPTPVARALRDASKFTHRDEIEAD